MTLSEAARRYLTWGTERKPVPFLHQGRNPNVGIDCVGLAVLAAQDCGFVAHDLNAYSRDPDNGLLEAMLEKNCGPRLAISYGTPALLAALRPDDIVSIDYKGETRHVAVVAENAHGRLSLIHTSSAHGRVAESPINSRWLKMITGVYRLGGAA